MAMIRCKGCSAEISKKAPICPHCGHPNPVAKHLGGGETLLALVVAGVVIWWLASREGSSAAPEDPKKAAVASLQLSDVSWTRGGFDTVMLLDVAISNRGSRAVKDVEIRCEHASPSGTIIDSNTATIYQVFPAGQTVEVKGFEMGFIHTQAERTNCRIENAVLI